MKIQNYAQTETMAQISGTVTELDCKYLTFWSDGQLFGLPIAQVVQIVSMQKIIDLPDCPSYAKGVINLRGSIIPLVDVRLRFGKSEREYNERSSIIVTFIHEHKVGFIVDGVNEVTDIDKRDVSVPPRMLGDSANGYIAGIAKKKYEIILLLDAEKILSNNAVDSLTKNTEEE